MKTKKLIGKNGTLVVEAALILPLISLLLVGVLEFGQILMIKQALTNAARESTRAAVVNLDDQQALASATTVAEDYLGRSGVDLTHVTIRPQFATVNGSQAVEVTIGYAYGSNFSAWIPGAPNILDLSSQVVMRREA